ncbi:AraC family transcriptional regulator [Kitasatospora sp. NPDC008050]|uniref:AraC family transcriptional regulator n=1 Tax=Kitasatospora sp. NPDC008050 TaxID=3364021 RepID=UPI0036EE737F
MDVLSDVISAMRTGRPFANREDRAGNWHTPFEAFAGAGFHVVLQGSCQLVPPTGPPTVLSAGDVVLTPRGTEHSLTGQGPGTATSLLCGAYQMDQSRPHPLLAALPEIIHLPAQVGRHPSLSSAVALLGGELQASQPGGDAAVPTLLDLLLLYLLRAWLKDEADGGTSGWSAALGDPAINRALSAIHGDPSRLWTVEDLGREAHLSRAAFSRRFTALVGEPPLTYLTWWRLTVAARLLRDCDAPLSSVAQQVGYSSAYAFANAFKRAHGIAPGQYRHERRAGQDTTQWPVTATTTA